MLGLDLTPLIELMRTDKLPQVLLFSGREGLGKTLFMRELASHRFCEKGTACQQCASCLLLKSDEKAGEHPNIHILAPAPGKALKSADLVTALTQLENYPLPSRSPLYPTRRLLLIEDADRLSRAAMNKLLKTLEEPPAHVDIQLSSSRPSDLLPTVLSRCIHWPLRPPTWAELEPWLRQLPYPFEEAQEAAARHGRAPGAILRALNEPSPLPGLCNALLRAKTTGEALKWAKKISEEKTSAFAALNEIEYALNKLYREQEGLPGQAQRRRLLAQARRLAGREKIALSTQLLCEQVALVALPRK